MTNQSRLFIIFVTLSSTTAVRNFDLLFTGTTCSARANYTVDEYCVVNKANHRLNVYFKIIKEILEFHIDLSVNLIRKNGDIIHFFKIKNLDGCSFLRANTTQPILKMFSDIMLKFGNWPVKCPVPEGFEAKLSDVALDPNTLPTFVPDVEINTNILLFDKKIKFWDLRIFGKLVHKKRNGAGKK